MVVPTTLDARRTALLQYDLHASAGRRSRSPYASADSQGVPTTASNLPVRASSVPVSEIRDRVTISSEAYARTAPRHITYDVHGNLSAIVQPRVLTGAAAYAETIRDQVTLVLKPPPGAVRRGAGAEPAQILVWFSTNAIPEPG